MKEFNVRIKRGDLFVSFDKPYTVLSSGLLNAGFVKTQAIVNHHVPCTHDCENCKDKKPLDEALKEVVETHTLSDNAVVLMTAADMENHSNITQTIGCVSVTAVITAGASNATRAGEPASWLEKDGEFQNPGTINIILVTNACLSKRAMVGSVITATEAKTAALRKLGVKSKYSGKPATGTGTDSIAVASDPDGPKITYAGAHAKFGEIIGKTVISGVLEAIRKQDGLRLK